MKIDTLRMVVGFTIIASHLLSFMLILLWTTRFTMDERIQLSLLISPIFAVYVTAIVRRFTTADNTYDDAPTHIALRILSIGTALVFGCAVPSIIYLFILGTIDGFASLKATIGIVETALGIYTGAVVDRLFGSSQARH
jgi:hypothetical protein